MPTNVAISIHPLRARCGFVIMQRIQCRGPRCQLSGWRWISPRALVFDKNFFRKFRIFLVGPTLGGATGTLTSAWPSREPHTSPMLPVTCTCPHLSILFRGACANQTTFYVAVEVSSVSSRVSHSVGSFRLQGRGVSLVGTTAPMEWRGAE